MTKSERLLAIQHILLAHPEGITRAEIARKLDIHRSSAGRYIDELTVLIPIWEDEKGFLGLQRDGYLKSLGLIEHRDVSKDLSILISEGENELLEFKVSACWDNHYKNKNSRIIENIVKTVVGFMNSKTGGSLLIGIADNGDIVGLADDYVAADSKKPNRDGYQLFLQNILNDNLGREYIIFYKISFHKISDKEICRIQVQSASRPVYYKGQFYARNGNQTLLFTTQEAVEYIKDRWS